MDTSYFTPVARRKRIIPVIKRRLKPTDTLITFVGRLIWAKGATKIYQVYRRLLPTMKKNVYLAIAGSGPLREKLRTQIERDHLSHRVWFLGALDTKRVREVLQSTDIFVHPSHHNEGFPNVILEAGAVGNYVIATDVAGVREIILQGHTGALIPAGEERLMAKSLKWALTHRVKSRSIGIALRQSLIQQFDWLTLSQEYMRLIEQHVQQILLKRTGKRRFALL